MNEIMPFLDFLKHFFPTYVIDEENRHTLEVVSQWVNRDKKFEENDPLFSLKKGLAFLGPVGTGKTDLMFIINAYFSRYLKSPYSFSSHVLWKFTNDFSKKDVGYAAFDGHDRGNRFYDELCLLKKNEDLPSREIAGNYHHKIIIGEEVIMFRAMAFKDYGYMTHFTSNEEPGMLENVYGTRAYDRLAYMCNFIQFTGESRRWGKELNLRANINEAPKVAKSAPVSEQEMQGMRQSMDEIYRQYAENPDAANTGTYGILYYTLVSLGCKIDVPEYRELLSSESMNNFSLPVGVNPDSDRAREMRSVHAKDYVNKGLVVLFFRELLKNGATSIFGEVSVDVDNFVKQNAQ